MEKIKQDKIRKLIETEKGLLLYFFSDDCAPCMALRPKIKELFATEFPEIRLMLLNASELPETAAGLGVFSSPTLIIFLDGSEFRRYGRNVSLAEIARDLERPYRICFE